MLKGTSMENRNRAWESRHLAKRAKRDAKRKAHLLQKIAFQREQNQKQREAIAKQAKADREFRERDLRRGRLGWLWLRYSSLVGSWFKKVANIFNQKHDVVKAQT